jgi:hypothetical protein
MNKHILFITLVVAFIAYVSGQTPTACIAIDKTALTFCKDLLPKGWQVATGSQVAVSDKRAHDFYNSLIKGTNITTTCASSLLTISCEKQLSKCTATTASMSVCPSVCDSIKTNECKDFTGDFSNFCGDDLETDCYDGKSSASGIKGSVVLTVIAVIVTMLF